MNRTTPSLALPFMREREGCGRGEFIRPCKSGLYAAIESLSGLILMLATLQLAAEEKATPYRPTVATPAELPQAGRFELEAGWLRLKQGDLRGNDFGVLLKYAFNEQIGILLADNPSRRISSGDTSIRGRGDSAIGIKLSHAWREGLASGLEIGSAFATSTRALGIDKAEPFVTGITSLSGGPCQLDLNLGLVKMSQTEQGIGVYQYRWAAAHSYAVNKKVSLATEISGLARRGTRPEKQVLAGVLYSLNPKIVIDFAYFRGVGESNYRGWTTGLTVRL